MSLARPVEAARRDKDPGLGQGDAKMNCQKVQSLISAYVDGEIAGHEMLAIRHHLAGCPECAAEHEALLSMKRAFGKLCPPRPAEDLAARICGRLVEVHVPFYVRMTAAVRDYFHAFPAGVRFSMAAVAVIAGLLMIRGGDAGEVPGFGGVPISSATFQTFAEERPFFVGTATPAAAVTPAAVYQESSDRWNPARDTRYTYGSRVGGLVLSGYTP